MKKKELGVLKIGLIQMGIVWESPLENMHALDIKIDTCSKDVDIIVLPEMFTTGFTMSPENITAKKSKLTLDWMIKKARDKNLAIIGSIVFKEAESYFNRLFFVKPNGEYSSYDKRHAFTLAGEHKKYQSGNQRLIVDYKGFKICPLICYDLRFPVWSRNNINYDILIYVANWPTARVKAWDTLLNARAIENVSYCLGVNRIGVDETGHHYPGHTSAYDPLGEQIAMSYKEEVVEVKVSKTTISNIRKKLCFLDDQDAFNLED